MGKVKSLRELQLVELEILKDFVRFCKEKKLTYYISGGTFLGAVRHKGFIPWDDDVDVAMPRSDYEVFLKEYKGRYKVATYRNDKESPHYAIRLVDEAKKVETINGSTKAEWSAWIDVFPLDGMPNNYFIRKIHSFRLMKARAELGFITINQIPNKKKRPLIEKVLIKIAKRANPFKRRSAIKQFDKIDRILKTYPETNSKYYINFMGSYKLKSILKKDYYYKEGAFYDFEGMKLFGPKNYDAYLKVFYGDYMLPPKKDERNKHGTQLKRIEK